MPTAAETGLIVRAAVLAEVNSFWTGKGVNDVAEEVWSVDEAIQEGTEQPSTVGRRVWVGIEPTGLNRVAASRTTELADVPIRVVVFERFTDAGPPTVEWCDDLFKFTHELRHRLSDARRDDWGSEAFTDFPPESVETDFDFDPDQLTTLKTWVAAFVVMYRGEVEAE